MWGLDSQSDRQVYVHIYIQFTEHTHSLLYIYICIYKCTNATTKCQACLKGLQTKGEREREGGERERHKCEHQWKVNGTVFNLAHCTRCKRHVQVEA